MTHVSEGWAFLVARGRRVGYRTLLAPGFLVDQNLQRVLAESTGVSGPGTSVVELEHAQAGRFSIAYTSELLARTDVGEAGSDPSELLTDEHGRPLEIVYGVVSRAELEGPLDTEDLREARAHALQSYRRFMADEEGHRVDTSVALELRTRTRKVTAVSWESLPANPGATIGESHRWSRSGRGVAGAIAVSIALAAVVTGTMTITFPEPTRKNAGVPLATTVLTPPQPVIATDGRRHVVYELRLDNETPERVRVDSVEVHGGSRGSTLAIYENPRLAALVDSGVAGGAARAVTRGQPRVLFLDVRLPAGRAPPAKLEHRLVVTVTPKDGRARRVMFMGAATRLNRQAPVRIELPLLGRNLAVTDSLRQGENRRTTTDIKGQVFLARRFAIDFQQYDDHGIRTFAGDPDRNESYFIYDRRVVAAARGPVVTTRDGVPDGAPRATSSVAPSDAQGNFVVQDLGAGRFAVYAHLKEGSVRVKRGEHVRRGQLLGRVGNSGESTAPRLQFRVMDARGGVSTLAANGLAFVFDRFTLDGCVSRRQRSACVQAHLPRLRTGQHPLRGDILGARRIDLDAQSGGDSG